MNDTYYEITITEKGTERVMGGNEWRKVNDIPSTEYAYTPEIEVTKPINREIYMQKIKEIDLTAIINAVNSPAISDHLFDKEFEQLRAGK